MQNRVIQDGDQFQLLIETNGPGGFFTELGRTGVFGKPTPEMLDEFQHEHRLPSRLYARRCGVLGV